MAKYLHSKVKTYEQCPQKYKFRYIDGIQAERRTIEAFLGDVVHQTLRKLYSDLQAGRSTTYEELLSSYKQHWDSQYAPTIKIVRGNASIESYFESGSRMIQGYYRWFHPFTDASTLGLELEVSFPIATDAEFHGFVDRVTQTSPHRYEIHDYKTSRRLPSTADVKRDLQLPLYEIAVRHTLGADIREVTLVWHYLAFDREFRCRRSSKELEATKQTMLRSIGRIESARGFPTRETPLCDWCEYYEICPAKQRIVLPSILQLAGSQGQSPSLIYGEGSGREGKGLKHPVLSAFRWLLSLLWRPLRFILVAGASGQRTRRKQGRKARRRSLR